MFFQFQSTAPSGVLSKQSFVDTFETMVSVAYGMEQLPDQWMNINPAQVAINTIWGLGVRVMVFNGTFSNISVA